MADNWYDYFYGSPEQNAADQLDRQRKWEQTTSSPAYRALRRLSDNPVEFDGRVMDPRAMRMGMVADTLYPSRNTEYVGDLTSKPGELYSAVFETTMRPRDTLIRAGQEIAGENYLKAAELLARAPLSVVYPPAAAGTPGSDDDWREDARRLGISDGNIAAIDIGTDPETYLPVPIPFMAAGRAIPMARGAMSAARYGRGVPTHLVDMSGDEIRRLLNSPRTRSKPMAIEYVR